MEASHYQNPLFSLSPHDTWDYDGFALFSCQIAASISRPACRRHRWIEQHGSRQVWSGRLARGCDPAAGWAAQPQAVTPAFTGIARTKKGWLSSTASPGWGEPESNKSPHGAHPFLPTPFPILSLLLRGCAPPSIKSVEATEEEGGGRRPLTSALRQALAGDPAALGHSRRGQAA